MKNLKKHFAILTFYIITCASLVAQVTVNGELKQWHKVTLNIVGPEASETGSPNPFLDYKLTVTFTQDDLSYDIPGYFAADGDAANSSATSGTIWRVHFTPPTTGNWNYTIRFRSGANVATDSDIAAGTAVGDLDNSIGTFEIGETDKTGIDLRAKGRLEYVGEHHLQFAGNGEWFFKAGPDSPENMLAYDDFDNTPNEGNRRKSWAPHAIDWNEGDPSWKDGKGTELIGAINYLASRGLNTFSFLTMNINGDDKNVYPYVTNSNFTQFDCSKLDQWEIIFEHAQKVGMHLHFKTQETENEKLLDGGNTGINRKVYYRELIARFGHHLALEWNLGEENGQKADANHQTTAQRIAMAKYFHDTDPYKNNVVIHTYPGEHNLIYTPLLGANSELTGVSIQTDYDDGYTRTKDWVTKSAAANKKWVVAHDEQGNYRIGVPVDAAGFHHNIRREVLWGNIMAGGAGVNYYFGYETEGNDLDCQDYRLRELSWRYCGHALLFLNRYVPFWDMKSDESKTTSGWCLHKNESVYLVYLPQGGSPNVDLGSGTYNVSWFDPENGGDLIDGNAGITGGGFKSIGSSPSTSQDWVALIQNTNYSHTCNARCNNDYAVVEVTISPEYVMFDNIGDSEQLVASIYPSNAADKSIIWSTDNAGVATVDDKGVVTAIANGQANVTATTNDGKLTASVSISVGATDLKIKYGPNYVIWEPQETISDLGAWVLRTPDDPKYMEGTNGVGPMNQNYLEFTGNNINSGDPNSPLVYKFIAPSTGEYILVGRMLQNLEGAEWDKCNDVWIKMDGDFTPGSDTYPESDLRSYTKFYGRGKDNWGSICKGDINHVYKFFKYNLKQGEEYTVTMAGRAQRTCIDYLMVYESSINFKFGEEVDIATNNPEEYWPIRFVCKNFPAVDMKFTDIEGFTNATLDNKAGMDILQIGERGATAAAQMIYDGTDGEANFTINAMQETDGESTYRLSINGVLIGEATNDRIHGTAIPDYTIQSHLINEEPVALNDGDTIQIEFNNATNGLVPEGNLTATSRGRWVSLNICTNGVFTYYGLNFMQESFWVMPGHNLKPDLEILLPDGSNKTLVWTSDNPSIATVDATGLVTGVSKGVTNINVKTSDEEFTATCELKVITIGPYPNGDAINIPGKFEVENFNLGGEGVGYHDVDNENEGDKYRTDVGVDIENCGEGGFNVGYSAAGEWLNYTINVTKTATYSLKARVASKYSTGKFHIEIDDTDVTGVISVPNTGGWQNWTTVTKNGIELTKGEHVLKFAFDGNDWNSNWLSLTEDATAIENVDLNRYAVSAYPNPFSTELNMDVSHQSKLRNVSLYNLQGKLVYSKNIINACAGLLTINPSYQSVPKSIYLLKLSFTDKIETVKVQRN